MGFVGPEEWGLWETEKEGLRMRRRGYQEPGWWEYGIV